MKTVVVGAGPVGMLCALARADRGDEVVVVEKDGAGERTVMQYRHPHFFRPQLRMLLEQLAPQVWAAMLAAGGVPAAVPGLPAPITGLACRRSVMEEAFRAVVDADPRIVVRQGAVEKIAAEGGCVTGVVVDGTPESADLVLCCTGRSSTLGDEHREPAEGGPCGYSYVSRMYRALDGQDPFEGDHFPRGAMSDGYHAIVFAQDDATLSALFIRRTDDRGFGRMTTNDGFETVASKIPTLAPWIDPVRFTPITDVMKGGLLTNLYRRQGGPSGLVFVGDAVSTTSPMAGRGGVIGLGQAAALMGLLDTLPVDEARSAFELWCDENVRPWYEDHVTWDASLVSRWSGLDLDVEGPLPSDVICEAAAQDPEIAAAAGAFGAMLALPAQLAPMEERARAVLRTGWRPTLHGPSRDELAALLR